MVTGRKGRERNASLTMIGSSYVTEYSQILLHISGGSSRSGKTSGGGIIATVVILCLEHRLLYTSTISAYLVVCRGCVHSRLDSTSYVLTGTPHLGFAVA